jgi:hypothetical protein
MSSSKEWSRSKRQHTIKHDRGKSHSRGRGGRGRVVSASPKGNSTTHNDNQQQLHPQQPHQRRPVTSNAFRYRDDDDDDVSVGSGRDDRRMVSESRNMTALLKQHASGMQVTADRATLPHTLALTLTLTLMLRTNRHHLVR